MRKLESYHAGPGKGTSLEKDWEPLKFAPQVDPCVETLQQLK